MNASISTPTPSASAMGWMIADPPGTKEKKTENMMSAAAVTTRAEAVKPCRTDARASCVSEKCSRIRDTRNTW